MNKTIVILVLFLMPFLASAQFSLSPKVGMNYLWVGDRPSTFSADGSEKGWQAGVDLRLGKRVYFQPGIYYVSTGAAIQNFEDVKNIKTGKASYMKIPANIGYKLIHTGLFNLRIHGGGAATKLLNVSEKGEVAASDINPWHYGANVGAGIDLLLFSIDANYEIGLTDLYAFENNSRPAMFSVSVGLKF